MGYPGAFKGVLEEHEVAGPSLGLADRCAEVVQTSGVEPAYVVAEAAVVDDPAHEARAVEGRVRVIPAPDIGVAQVLFGLLHHRGEALVLEVFLWYLKFEDGVFVLGYVLRVREQVGPVAQRTHIHGVERELLLGEDIYGQVREVEVLQRDGADGVFILALAVGLDGLGEDVLPVKECAEHGFSFVHRPLPAEPRGEDGHEHIGVVLYVVDVHVVLVVVVRGLVAVEIVLQLGLHRGIRRLCAEHILVGTWVGREADAVQPALQEYGAGRERVHYEGGNKEKGSGYADALSMAVDELHRLLFLFRSLLCALSRGGGRGFALPRLGISLLDAAFLLLLHALRFGLRFACRALRELRRIADAALRRLRRAVCGLDADVVVLVLRRLAVHGGARQLGQLCRRARLLRLRMQLPAHWLRNLAAPGCGPCQSV